jgi:hypothetical protein
MRNAGIITGEYFPTISVIYHTGLKKPYRFEKKPYRFEKKTIQVLKKPYRFEKKTIQAWKKILSTSRS